MFFPVFASTTILPAVTDGHEGQKKEKTKSSLRHSIDFIIIMGLASSGSFCLVQGSTGSGVTITHNSWQVVRCGTATQTKNFSAHDKDI